MLESYLKQDNVAPLPHTTLSCLNQTVKFPLLRPLQFLSDLKSTIFSRLLRGKIIFCLGLLCGCSFSYNYAGSFTGNIANKIYILASDFFEKDDKYVFKARNLC